MKRPQVTQDNVYFFIPHKIAKICGELNRSQNMSMNDAILKVYNSPVYELLQKESTKLWQEGWVYIYNLLEK